MSITENPRQRFEYPKSFEQLKQNIFHVVNRFPGEYKTLNNQPDHVKILCLARYPKFQNVAGDMILTIWPDTSNDRIISFEMTNETGSMNSYTEAERDRYAIDIFIQLLAQSIAGALDRNAELATKKNQPSSISGVISLITLIIAIYAIYLGMKGCAH